MVVVDAQQSASSVGPSSSSSPPPLGAALNPALVERLEAGAFRRLCQHLQERSDAVQNIDLMTVGGFCRNCLAKVCTNNFFFLVESKPSTHESMLCDWLLQWMVLEARRLVDHDDDGATLIGGIVSSQDRDILNSLGYEQAAQHVYGTTYGEWKKRHQKKATNEQLQRYQESEPLHAVHAVQLLEPRGRTVSVAAPVVVGSQGTSTPESSSTGIHARKGLLLSNVCCEDVDAAGPVPVPPPPATADSKKPPKSTREVGPFVPPALPEFLRTRSTPLRIGVLTVSDRAFRREYATGDLSGPAVVHQVLQVLQPGAEATASSVVPPPSTIVTALVPDESDDIQTQLKAWCDNPNDPNDSQGSPPMDIILTTGETRNLDCLDCDKCISSRFRDSIASSFSSRRISEKLSFQVGRDWVLGMSPPKRRGPWCHWNVRDCWVSSLPNVPVVKHWPVCLVEPRESATIPSLPMYREIQRERRKSFLCCCRCCCMRQRT